MMWSFSLATRRGGFSKLAAHGKDMYGAHLIRSLKDNRETSLPQVYCGVGKTVFMGRLADPLDLH